MFCTFAADVEVEAGLDILSMTNIIGIVGAFEDVDEPGHPSTHSICSGPAIGVWNS
jgi:hypothetical protein